MMNTNKGIFMAVKHGLTETSRLVASKYYVFQPSLTHSSPNGTPQAYSSYLHHSYPFLKAIPAH